MFKQRYFMITFILLIISTLISSCSESKPKDSNDVEGNSAYVTFSNTGTIPVFNNTQTSIKILVTNNSNSNITNLQFINQTESLVSLSGCNSIKAHTDCVVTANVNLTTTSPVKFEHLVQTSFVVNNQTTTQNHWLQFQAVTNEDKSGIYISDTYLNSHNKSTMYMYATGVAAHYTLAGAMFNGYADAIINKDELSNINSGEVLAIFVDGSKLPIGNVEFSTNAQDNNSNTNLSLSETLSVTANSNDDAILSFISPSTVIDLSSSTTTVTHTLLNRGNIPVTIRYGTIDSPLHFGVDSSGVSDSGTCKDAVLESSQSCTVKVGIDTATVGSGLGEFNLMVDYENSNGYTTTSVTQNVGWYSSESHGYVLLSSAANNLNIGLESMTTITAKIDNLNNYAVDITSMDYAADAQSMGVVKGIISWDNCNHIAANSSCQFSFGIQARTNGSNILIPANGLLGIKATVQSGNSTYTTMLTPIIITAVDDRPTLTSFSVYGQSGTIDNVNNTITIGDISGHWISPNAETATFATSSESAIVTINDITQTSAVTTNDYLARYGDPRTGGNPMQIVVTAPSGKPRSYALTINTEQFVFKNDDPNVFFRFDYTSDTTKVKSYSTTTGTFALDPETGRFTSYNKAGQKVWQDSDTLRIDAMALDNGGNFVSYNIDTSVTPNVYTQVFGTHALYGAATEIVFYGTEFYMINTLPAPAYNSNLCNSTAIPCFPITRLQ